MVVKIEENSEETRLILVMRSMLKYVQNVMMKNCNEASQITMFYCVMLIWWVHEWVKEAMANSAREACGSVRMGRKNPKSEWWNIVERKEPAWMDVLGAKDIFLKERCMEL